MPVFPQISPHNNEGNNWTEDQWFFGRIIMEKYFILLDNRNEIDDELKGK